jgi:hypothetical protein
MSSANPPSLTITAVSAAADEQSLVRVRQLKTLHAPKARFLARWGSTTARCRACTA